MTRTYPLGVFDLGFINPIISLVACWILSIIICISWLWILISLPNYQQLFRGVPCLYNPSFSAWFSRFLRQIVLNICFLNISHKFLPNNFVIFFLPSAILCWPLFLTPSLHPVELLTECNFTQALIHITCYFIRQGFGSLPLLSS